MTKKTYCMTILKCLKLPKGAPQVHFAIVHALLSLELLTHGAAAAPVAINVFNENVLGRALDCNTLILISDHDLSMLVRCDQDGNQRSSPTSWIQMLLLQTSMPSKPPQFPPRIAMLYTSPFVHVSREKWNAGASTSTMS